MTTPEPSRSPATTPEDYSEAYYRAEYWPPYEATEPHWATFFNAVATQLLAHLRVKSVLDVGCAKGFFVEALLGLGVDAYGVDVSPYAIAEAAEAIRDRVWVHDLAEPLTGRWDLVTCIEVIEHMSPPEAQRAIDHMTAVADLVLISTTPNHFEEPTHVNVHPMQDWAEWFAIRGFFRRTDVDLSGLSPWATVFERRALSVPAVVHLYEAELAPLREEVIVKRNALLNATRRFEAELAATTPPNDGDTEGTPPSSPADTATSPADIASLDRMLALTDEVIGLQAELAEARYQQDLAETALDTVPAQGRSVYKTGKNAPELVEHAQLTLDIELRQGLLRQLAEERARADEAERQLSEIRSSLSGRAKSAARSTARAARRRWR